MSLAAFAIAALAVWRLTHLLAAEDGPWGLCARLRARLGGGALGRMVGCFHCLSVWVALLLAPWLSMPGPDLAVAWAALSAAAILIERVGAALDRHAEAPPEAPPAAPRVATWQEDPPEAA